MKLYLNNKEFYTEAQELSVDDLLRLNNIPAVGVAVAVNNSVVRKSTWKDTLLADGDSITVITAVCGG